MNTQEILNSNATKTEKIRQLLELGLTRRQVADLTGGNYGFVQNVFARYWPERVISRNAFRFIPFNRKFGVEIEAYGADKHLIARLITEAGVNCMVEGYNHTTRRHWKIITDGSLNGANAFEIVSPILEGTAGMEELRKVCTVLESNRVKINKSCGMHIHFDASEMGFKQIQNLVLNYAKAEEAIDSFMPQSRRASNNTYCMSIMGSEAKVKQATTIGRLQDIYRSRYYKLNLQSYSRHQTVEFRQHSGTVEFQKISNWIFFLHNLVEYSRTKLLSNGTMTELNAINQPEINEYLTTRQNQLAA